MKICQGGLNRVRTYVENWVDGVSVLVSRELVPDVVESDVHGVVFLVFKSTLRIISEILEVEKGLPFPSASYMSTRVDPTVE